MYCWRALCKVFAQTHCHYKPTIHKGWNSFHKYQKYLATSIKVGCATRILYASSGPKAEGVPTNNQRGRGSGPCRLWGGLDKARHIVPTALLVRVQRFRNDLYKAVKGPSTRPIVLKPERKARSESRDIDENDIVQWHGETFSIFCRQAAEWHWIVFVYEVIGYMAITTSVDARRDSSRRKRRV